MRILVDSCSYTGQNVGDLAMLRVAVSRLRQLWPDASIQVITDAPQAVAAQSGSVEPVPVRGRRKAVTRPGRGGVRVESGATDEHE